MTLAGFGVVLSAIGGIMIPWGILWMLWDNLATGPLPMLLLGVVLLLVGQAMAGS